MVKDVLYTSSENHRLVGRDGGDIMIAVEDKNYLSGGTDNYSNFKETTIVDFNLKEDTIDLNKFDINFKDIEFEEYKVESWNEKTVTSFELDYDYNTISIK